MTKNKQQYAATILGTFLLFVIGFWWYQSKPKQTTQNPEKPVPNTNLSEKSFGSFSDSLYSVLQDLNSSENVLVSQNAFWKYIEAQNPKNLPSKDEYLKMISQKDIPEDYHYFFKECLPHYLENLKHIQHKITDKNILFSTKNDSILKINLLFNQEKKSSKSLLETLPIAKKRIIVSGTYTSPFDLPVGLAVDKGNIVNPCMQSWDGLFLIDKNNKPQILNIRDVSLDFEILNIRENIKDYSRFLEVLKRQKISVIQSHLLLYNDSICVEKYAQQTLARRRVIFQTADGHTHIFDSLDKQMTLFELAQYLQKNYAANRAINLDMGDYNYCKMFENGKEMQDRSVLRNGIVLSNFIVIDY